MITLLNPKDVSQSSLIYYLKNMLLEIPFFGFWITLTWFSSSPSSCFILFICRFILVYQPLNIDREDLELILENHIWNLLLQVWLILSPKQFQNHLLLPISIIIPSHPSYNHLSRHYYSTLLISLLICPCSPSKVLSTMRPVGPLNMQIWPCLPILLYKLFHGLLLF